MSLYIGQFVSPLGVRHGGTEPSAVFLALGLSGKLGMLCL